MCVQTLEGRGIEIFAGEYRINSLEHEAIDLFEKNM